MFLWRNVAYLPYIISVIPSYLEHWDICFCQNKHFLFAYCYAHQKLEGKTLLDIASCGFVMLLHPNCAKISSRQLSWNYYTAKLSCLLYDNYGNFSDVPTFLIFYVTHFGPRSFTTSSGPVIITKPGPLSSPAVSRQTIF